MAKVMAKLRFESYDKWRPAFDEAEKVRKAHGVKGTQVFQNADNPNEVVILYEWDDLEDAWPFFEQLENKKSTGRTGITGKTRSFYSQRKEYLLLIFFFDKHY